MSALFKSGFGIVIIVRLVRFGNYSAIIYKVEGKLVFMERVNDFI